MNFAFFRMNNNEDEVFQLTHNRRMQIQTYRNFSEQTALHYWCCVCLKNLYPEEVHYNKNLRIDNNLPAYRWGYTAQTNAKGHAVTCRSHKETSIIKDTEFIFPGKELEITKQLNYRELSMLSPIKLMSKMTRKKSGFHGRLGHYELSGDVYIKFNYEFASMLYQGSSSLFFIDNANRLAINMQVVRAAWKELTDQNPLLKQYRLPHIESALVKHHVSTYPERVGLRDNTHGEYSDYINRDNNWENKMARPLADGTAGIAEDGEEFLRLLIGSDTNNIKVTYSHPLLLCLLFPYLFTNGKGFYSLKKRSEKLFQHSYIPKETDLASYNNITLREFSKMLLLGKDRRFAKDPSFIFILLDIIEKQTIFSYNRRVIQLYGTTNYKAKDIRVFDVNRGKTVINTRKTSVVPLTLRSSTSYKKKMYLDLATMFDNYGEPTIFLTITCADFSSEYKAATNCEKPWEDPVLFSLHFKRKFQHFFHRSILKNFPTIVGPIKHYAWVLEVQDRGSPHIHAILWTERKAETLLADNVVIATLPSIHDPYYETVARLQTHTCSNYCLRGNISSQHSKKSCRFGFPFDECDTPHKEGNRFKYKRGRNAAFINSYNPLLLRILETHMDMQLNAGRQALYYLCKYMTKLDNQTKVFMNTANNNMDLIDVHLKTRVIGAVEAVYHIMGWHIKRFSTKVIYINTNMPNYDRRQLIDTIMEVDDEEENIFVPSQIEKYEKRNKCLDFLTLPQYYTYYRIIYKKPPSWEEGYEEFDYVSEDDDDADEEEESQDSNAQQSRYRQRNATVSIASLEDAMGDTVQRRLPVTIRDGYGKTWTLRKSKAIPLYRTRKLTVSHGEAFFYQQIVLYYPSTKFDDLKAINENWLDVYKRLVATNNMQPRIPESFYSGDLSTNEDDALVNDLDIQHMLESLNIIQYEIFSNLLINIRHGTPSIVLGGAGTGKSYLLKLLYLHFKKEGYKVKKLAPTGIAAYNIGGATYHSFFGIDTATSSVNLTKLDMEVKDPRPLLLLIDECSMISEHMVNTIDISLRTATNCSNIFGNIPVVFFGDFGQLRPIESNATSFFKSFLYSNCFTYKLLVNQRQVDEQYIKILNKVRENNIDKEVYNFIKSKTVKIESIPVTSLKLFMTNEEVKRENFVMLRRIFIQQNITIRLFQSMDYVSGEEKRKAKTLLDKTLLVEKLEIGIGCRVMLLQNLNIQNGWVNGTLAEITNIRGDYIEIKRNEDGMTCKVERITRTIPDTSYSRTQFPLRLAFASTIAKVQSLTLQSVAISAKSFDTHGTLYVAMSRVKTANDVQFFGYDPARHTISITADKECLDFIKDQ